MKQYQCKLLALYERLGSWRAVAEHLGGRINHATLHRYAHGDRVFDREHRRILGMTRQRERRVAVHCSDIDSAFRTLSNPDNFTREFIVELMDRILTEYLYPFEV